LLKLLTPRIDCSNCVNKKCDKSKCYECKSGYYSKDYKCVSNCGDEYYVSGGTCQSKNTLFFQ